MRLVGIHAGGARLTFSVVTPAGSGVDQSTGNPADQELVGDLEFQRLVELLLRRGQHRVELFGLNDGPGEPIEDEAAKDQPTHRQATATAYPFLQSLLVAN
jgi:hypothetical protein